jgi:hypothetical protein
VEFNFKGSGDGFDIRLKVKWLSLVAFCKAALWTVITLAGLVVTKLAVPEIARLGTLLGWW